MSGNNINGVMISCGGTSVNVCDSKPQEYKKYHLDYYRGYLKTFPGILKISELLCVLVAFIISCLDQRFLYMGGTWLSISTAISFFVSLFFLLFHVFLLHRKVSAPWCVIEAAAYFCVCLLVFSGGVLSAAYSYVGGLIIAETIFIFMGLAIYMIDSLVALKIFTAGHYYE